MNPQQCRAARAWLDWTQVDFSEKADIGLSTIKDFEAGNRKTNRWVIRAMRATFEAHGVAFIHDHGISVLERKEQFGGLLAALSTEEEGTPETQATDSGPRVRSVG